MVLGVRFVSGMVKVSVLFAEAIFELDTVGAPVVLKQIPFSCIEEPPLLVMLPPVMAEVVEMEDAVVVLTVGNDVTVVSTPGCLPQPAKSSSIRTGRIKVFFIEIESDKNRKIILPAKLQNCFKHCPSKWVRIVIRTGRQ